ncbi:hypothetical protein L6R52_14005 [Myxococcota bacterium]|nr:hypothetical protein [Myxococcota bacterium]
MRSIAAVVVLLSVAACVTDPAVDGGLDRPDTGVVADTGGSEADAAELPDAAPDASQPADAATQDAAPDASQPADASALDAALDASQPADAEPADATADASQPADASAPDAGEVDAGEIDGGVDPCAAAPCFPGVACTASGGGFTCGVCPSGLVGDGITCVDEDGCFNAPCFPGVACTDVPAPGTGYSCGACPSGYSGDGVTCIDTDECLAAPCFPGVACTDVPAPGTGYSCGACPSGYSGDGVTCTDVDGCVGSACFPGVACTDVPAPGTGYSCGACPSGLAGDGITCVEADGCAGAPCLTGTTCTDVPAPGTGFTCSVCTGAACPILRAQAGPDQTIVAGAVTTLLGDAVGYNGAFSCQWTNDRDATVRPTCTATVAPTQTTIYTLTVTDASGLTASDSVEVAVAALTADAGPAHNIVTGGTSTLTASWAGASCADGSCITCAWTLSGGAIAGTTCTLPVSPTATTQYTLTVTDTANGRTATDGTTVFVTNAPAQLCGWNVVVMTSNEYPTAANPNYTCDATGTARRQTVNGKPAIVLSDLSVRNTKIVGYISVETTSDDDLIGFFWGWQSPAHAYLLSWKQASQNWTANCGNALSGIAVKKVDGPAGAAETITFNSSFGYLATDFVYSCAVGWSTDRNNAALFASQGTFLHSPRDVGAFTTGWRDFITYRFEFYYTPTRTKIFVYEDELMNGSTTTLVTTLDITDSSYPEGQFAFFSNSQEQVAFGDFTLASLDGYSADAGPDGAITAGQPATLTGTADLAVPPYTCEWLDGATLVGNTCTLAVTPAATTTYTLVVTDAFGRLTSDDVMITVTP